MFSGSSEVRLDDSGWGYPRWIMQSDACVLQTLMAVVFGAKLRQIHNHAYGLQSLAAGRASPGTGGNGVLS